jgi:hypothetical protein
VRIGDLDPETVPPRLFGRAQVSASTAAMDEMMKMIGLGWLKRLNPLRRMFKKTPEMEEQIGELLRKDMARSRKSREGRKVWARRIELEPFGALKFHHGVWEKQDVFPSWAGFQSRGGPYSSADSPEPSKGEVTVMIAPPGGGEDAVPPAKEQIESYSFLKEHEKEMAEAVLGGILADYPKLREAYGLDDDKSMPKIRRAEEFKKLIGLGTVHVLSVAKSGRAYVGFEFGCEWDEEHGLGVLTHEKRVVGVGNADTAFDANVAEDDGGRSLVEQEDV